MIHVTVKREHPTKIIRETTVSGHALYDDYGKDIVCAAVSAVVINLINASEVLLHVPLETRQDDGEIVCRVPHIPKRSTAEHVQLLMETLVYSLKSIAEEYPSSISVEEYTV